MACSSPCSTRVHGLEYSITCGEQVWRFSHVVNWQLFSRICTVFPVALLTAQRDLMVICTKEKENSFNSHLHCFHLDLTTEDKSLPKNTYHITPFYQSWSNYKVKTGVFARTLRHHNLVAHSRVEVDDPAVEIVVGVQPDFHHRASSSPCDISGTSSRCAVAVAGDHLWQIGFNL